MTTTLAKKNNCIMKTTFIALTMMIAITAMAQDEIRMETYTYAVKGQDTLKLDVYTCPSARPSNKQLAYVYSFGGGWETGTRADANMMQKFARQGYVAISIDYRRMIERIKKEGVNVMDAEHFSSSFSKAIRTGVEDLYDATAWIVEHADMLNIDTTKIVISGGSAGATNSVMAEYYLCNGDELAQRLPKGFRYAGVIPFAGGIWKAGLSEPEWKTKPCPFCIIHGDKDQLVPYEKNVADALNFSAFGPAYYTRQLEKMKVPFMFLTGVNADHLLSAAPIIGDDVDYSEYVFSFIERMVLGKEKLAQRITESYYDDPYSFEFMIRKVMEQKVKEEQNK